ncbi:ABC transporter ATP-binding protein [Feifania hominis]|uniref:ABC transporter ATP-binding protein n=1 Tax=Feifania hominis TaxID=2763660 RepID=A0A926HST2_9FIRM|nr:ABC transporter ATP-binding protein [Feifania hominis]MBC8535144.1 ABC transporter ATP-binding protein [Feifania hominis]
MLKISNLHAYYGTIEALRGVDLEIRDGQICTIIGANGAGKTTLLKSISGIVNRTGLITWDEEDISKCNSLQTVRKGIVHVPEGRLVFPGLSVRENLEMGTINWHGFFGRKPYDEDLEKVYELFPRLLERKDQKAWSLSGGEQQMLAIGRGMMARPKLLMLDEPSMGLAPKLVDEMFKKIVEINRTHHIPILLIEQNANLALEISDYAYVLDQGKIAVHGPADELRTDPQVTRAYLGAHANESVHVGN